MACDSCGFRRKYNQNPQSLLGRFCRWHANWRPGWKKYMLSLPGEERIRLAEKYDFKKFK